MYNKLQQSTFYESVFGNERKTNRFPVLNGIIAVYICFTTLWFILVQIAPFLTITTAVPIYSMKTYLGCFGAVLLAVDLFTNKGLWRGYGVVLLYGICIFAALASIRTIEYGIKDNLFILAWTGIQFGLFYSLAYRLNRNELYRLLRILYWIVLAVWFIACCLSFLQFVFQTGYMYVVDPLSDDLSFARQGFLEHRLFGIFNPLNHAAYVSLIMVIASGFFMAKEHSKLRKILLIVLNLPIIFHILLSNSRSAFLSLLVCIFIGTILLIKRKTSNTNGKIRFMVFVSAILVTAASFGICTVLKKSLALIPPAVEKAEIKAELVLTGLPDDSKETDQSSTAKKKKSKKRKKTKIIETETDSTAAELLEREGLENDYSNDRFKIWKDYLSLYEDVGLIGLSPGNYMAYIRENEPDAYIVSYIRENFPQKYEGGLIYHVHNGYLMTYVSAGIVGTVLMIAFFVLGLIRTLRFLLKKKELSFGMIFVILIVCQGLISAVFDKGIFFMDNGPTFVFWIAYGILMRYTKIQDKTGMDIPS